MSRTRILIVSDSAALPTARAEIVRLIFDSLVSTYSHLYEVRQIALDHTFAVTTPKWPVYPTKTISNGTLTALDPDDLLGQRTFPEVAAEFEPHIVFALNIRCAACPSAS